MSFRSPQHKIIKIFVSQCFSFFAEMGVCHQDGGLKSALGCCSLPANQTRQWLIIVYDATACSHFLHLCSSFAQPLRKEEKDQHATGLNQQSDQLCEEKMCRTTWGKWYWLASWSKSISSINCQCSPARISLCLLKCCFSSWSQAQIQSTSFVVSSVNNRVLTWLDSALRLLLKWHFYVYTPPHIHLQNCLPARLFVEAVTCWVL